MAKLYRDANSVVNSIYQRYFYGIPHVFNELERFEKMKLYQNKKYKLTLEDCIDVLEKNIVLGTGFTKLMSSEVIYLMYQWSKAKIVYDFTHQRKYPYEVTSIHRDALLEIPYPAIYVHYNFTGTNYKGFFMSILWVHDKKNRAIFRRQCIIGLVEYFYSSHTNEYSWGIEPIRFYLDDGDIVTENLKKSMTEIEPAFISSNQRNANIIFECGAIAIKIYYQILRALPKRLKTNSHGLSMQPRFKKEVKEYSINYRSGYTIHIEEKVHNKSKNQKLSSTRSYKRPHAVRSHPRRYKIKDKDGNIVDYYIIKIESYTTGKNKNLDTTIHKVIN